MILSADNPGLLSEFCRRDVFGTRIAAYCSAYFGIISPSVGFWYQTDGMEITAAVSRIDGSVTLCCSERANLDEIARLLCFSGFSNIQCSAQTAERFPDEFSAKLTDITQGAVVEYKGCEIESNTDKSNYFSDYKSAYSLLCDCGFETGNYDSWLADFSLRARRGLARLEVSYVDSFPVATASALFITDFAVLLGGIGTLPEYRGKGFAGDLIKKLAAASKGSGKRVELLCKPELVGFYEKSGFEKVSEWVSAKHLD